MLPAVTPPPDCSLDEVLIHPYDFRADYVFVRGCTFELRPPDGQEACAGEWPRIKMTSAYAPTRRTPLFSASAAHAVDLGNGEYDVAFPSGVTVSIDVQRYRYPGPVTLRVRLDALRRGRPIRASH